MIDFHGVPIHCINQAAVQFHVPAKIIISVMSVEGGRNGMRVKNKNGTYDYGVMQINSSWSTHLTSYGIRPSDLQYNPCINVQVGAWILAQGMAESNGWLGVGNYHSHTPYYNERYRKKVRGKFVRFNQISQEGLV